MDLDPKQSERNQENSDGTLSFVEGCGIRLSKANGLVSVADPPREAAASCQSGGAHKDKGHEEITS